MFELERLLAEIPTRPLAILIFQLFLHIKNVFEICSPKSRFCLPFLIVSCFQTFGGFQNVSVPRSTNLALDFSGSEALDFDLQRSVFAFQKRRSDATSKNVQQTFFRESSGNGKKIEKVKKGSGQTYSSFHRCEKMFSELIPGL